MKTQNNENSVGKWLRQVSVQNKFSIIIGLIVFILLFETGNFWLGTKISSSLQDSMLWLTLLLNIILGAIVIFVATAIRKIIVQVDRAKSEFVSLASHQLRTPLTVIKWYSSTLMDAQDTGRIPKELQKEYVQKIYETSKHMMDLVAAILNVSRIDLGTLAVEPKPITLSEVAKEILGELELEITAKSLVIKTEFEPDLPALMADPKLIRILMQNLLTNAIKYSKIGGEITCAIKVIGNDFQISVVDQGIGIPAKDKGKIYDKFFRTEAARKLDPNGNGLGMYIVKAIVNEAKGKIWFESKEGAGSTFYVIIPLSGMKGKAGVRDLAESYS